MGCCQRLGVKALILAGLGSLILLGSLPLLGSLVGFLLFIADGHGLELLVEFFLLGGISNLTCAGCDSRIGMARGNSFFGLIGITFESETGKLIPSTSGDVVFLDRADDIGNAVFSLAGEFH